jgi:uncharacterized protein
MSEKKGRGFASMDEARQRAIASKGGKAAHQKGTAHEFTPEEAREAGRKGGQAAHQKGTAHQFTSEEARAAGRKGGQAARARNRQRPFSGEESASHAHETAATPNGQNGMASHGEEIDQRMPLESSSQS